MNYNNFRSTTLGIALVISLSAFAYLYLDDLYQSKKPKDE